MLKQAFRSYMTSFHPKYRKTMFGRQNYTFYRFLLWGILIRSLIWEKEVWLFLGLLPVAMMSWSSTDTRVHIEKPMFLCPMTYEMRRIYINNVLLVKIGVPMMLGIFLEIVWNFWCGFSIERSIIVLICYLSIGIGMHVHIDGIDKEDGKTTYARTDRSGKIRSAWINHVVDIWAIFLYGYAKELEFIGVDGEFYLYLFQYGTAALLLMDAVILLTQYRDMVAQAIDYELAFQIPGNLKYIEEES